MPNSYWTDRMDAAVAEARGAVGGDAKLVHYEAAGRYSLNAVRGVPFLLPRKEPATDGEREALRRPLAPRYGEQRS